MNSIKSLSLLFMSLFWVNSMQAQQLNFSWANAMGAPNIIGNASAVGISIAHDNFGNVFLAGTFQDTIDFDPGPGTAWLSSTGAYDIFLAKFNIQGNLVWIKSFAGTSIDGPVGLVVDNNGNPILLGQFQQTIDANPDPNLSNPLVSYGDVDMFIVKLDSMGNYSWSKQFGGVNADYPTMLRRDNLGNLIVSGTFRDSIDTDPSANVQYLVSNGNVDGFLVKLTNQGNYVWSKKLGANFGDAITGIDVDVNNNIYACGSFVGTVDFDPGVNVFNLTATPNAVGSFVFKWDASGNFVFAKPFLSTTSSGNITASYLNLDANGNIFVIGDFNQQIDFNPDVVAVDTITSSSNSQDVFLSKFSNSGVYQWTRIFGNSNIDFATAIVNDAQGNVFFKGAFTGIIDINPDPIDTMILNSAGGIGGRSDYICALNSTGGFAWGTKVFGFVNGYRGPTLDIIQNRFYHAGQFTGTGDFDPGPGVYNLSGVPGTGTAFFVQLIRTNVGLAEQVEQHGFSLYPNPTRNFLNIVSKEELQNAQISLCNMNGQVIALEKNVNGKSFGLRVDGFSEGMYLLQIRSEKSITTLKVIITH
ncbi:MAG: T9SS type A sorting domain-containing protein [Bacteroidetes bacterium]|nr:T9SS type A sorting domain-containing protein [Bacteroidota bacterium]